MKKYISSMNTQSFFYVWKNTALRKYLVKMIQKILNNDEEYVLNPSFNAEGSKIRSYIFLESKKRIVLVDFNKYENNLKINLDLDLVKYLQNISNKEISTIIFNDFPGQNKFEDNLYLLFKNKENDKFIRFFMSSNFKQQSEFDYHDYLDYLYSLDEKFYELYLNEITAEENIYNFYDL